MHMPASKLPAKFLARCPKNQELPQLSKVILGFFLNPIQGGGPELTVQGGGAKTPALHILVISPQWKL